MTREEYNNYYSALEPYINKTELVIHAYPDVLLTLLGTQEYEEGVNEHPRALFIGDNGKDADLELSVAVDLLQKGKK